MAAKIIAIGAGKGGVGKSFISTSLAITFAKQNLSVLILDFDLAGANVHTSLGVAPKTPSISAFLSGECSLANLIQATNIPRVSFIQGIWEEWEHANAGSKITKKLIAEAKNLPFDYVIIDLGPGPTTTNLELFKSADEKILVTSAEPTSIEKTYRFLESWMLFQLSENITGEALEKLKSSIKNFRAQKKRGVFSFREYLQIENSFTFAQFDELLNSPVKLILNETRSNQDQELGFSIKSVCNKFLDLHVEYLGFVDFDNAVWHSIRNHEPFLIAKPYTALSGQFLSIAKLIIQPEINANIFKAVI